ncbi:MAG TPA: 23S rRNA (adenine(2503)-C(2))-methyltransferase RlmN [Tenuifilaceae bacterium]|nr:23S rRNA (adenine(2503)-C(2))-methyltransferase RlmN [Tenuifilaceae bacterium]
MTKSGIVGLTPDELRLAIEAHGFKGELAKEICIWIYRRAAKSFLEMDNIPMGLREFLLRNYSLQWPQYRSFQTSADGSKKYLFETSDGNPYEAVFMPGPKRNTLCISTQSGCRMGCVFCHTGAMGFRENLSVLHIVGQLLSIPESMSINRIVVMGMGEPMDNPEPVFRALEIFRAPWGMAFGATNITLSTIGILQGLERLIHARCCNIAISLHSPFHHQRSRLIPAGALHSPDDIVSFFMVSPVRKPLRLSFEYVVIPNVNDSDEHAAQTAKLIKPLNCHVNVIPLNTPKGNENYRQCARLFRDKLDAHGQPATLRASRGVDIDAACGMMAGKGK